MDYKFNKHYFESARKVRVMFLNDLLKNEGQLSASKFGSIDELLIQKKNYEAFNQKAANIFDKAVIMINFMKDNRNIRFTLQDMLELIFLADSPDITDSNNIQVVHSILNYFSMEGIITTHYLLKDNKNRIIKDFIVHQKRDQYGNVVDDFSLDISGKVIDDKGTTLLFVKGHEEDGIKINTSKNMEENNISDYLIPAYIINY